MAFLCGVCNRQIEENSAVCPFCGADVAESRAKSIDNSVNSLLESMLAGGPAPSGPVDSKPDGLLNNPDISGGGAIEESKTQKDGGESDSAEGAAERPGLARTGEPEGFSVGPIPDVSGGPDKEDVSLETAGPKTRSGGAVPQTKKRNALESSFDTKPRASGSSGNLRFLTVFVVLAALALFTAVVMFVIVPMQQVKREKQEIVDFLEGAWISDKFAFFDSTSKNYVEVLTVDADGSFKMIYTIPDEASPDGWNTGQWKTEEQVQGRIDYVAEDLRLLLLYEQDGTNYFFERIFIVKDDDKICLREIYDESGEAFYDVVLYRIKM